MQPVISIVVTCYNYEKYVSACLRSVMDQTFRDFEVIVVNDGSTDNSEERIRPYLQDNRFKYIKQENGGQAKAKNRGIRESTGRYVAFLDADDIWHNDKIEKQLPLFDNENIGVVYTMARYINENDEDLNMEIEEYGKYLTPKCGNVSESLLFDNFVPFSSSIVRKDLIGNGFDESIKMAIDWKFWLNLSMICEFDYIPEKLLLYRIGHRGQMSKNAEERMRCTDYILTTFLKINSQQFDQNVVRKALAHKYYLRWEYFHRKEQDVAKKYLKMAMQQQFQPVRIAKHLAKHYLFRLYQR